MFFGVRVGVLRADGAETIGAYQVGSTNLTSAFLLNREVFHKTMVKTKPIAHDEKEKENRNYF